MRTIHWGIIGCGDVTEVKSGPAFQKARGSSLLAVTRRDRSKAEDYARRHNVSRVHASADDLIHDPDIDAVYIATHPDSHCGLACRVAEARKPCLVEKPMATSYAECVRMLEAFDRAKTPLWVAYYRRALPRFVMMRDLLEGGSMGRITSVQMDVREPLATGSTAAGWRFDRTLAGGGLFFDKGSHGVDLIDFLIGPVESACGVAVNTGGSYEVEDVTAATFRIAGHVPGAGLWNFNAGVSADTLVITTTLGEIRTSVFLDADLVITREGRVEVEQVRNPPHVHQPLIQTIVDELAGLGRCPSTGASGARASRVLEMCQASR